MEKSKLVPIATLLSLIVGITSCGDNTPRTQSVSDKTISALQNTIILQGYRCDTVVKNSVIFGFGTTYNVPCNDFQYLYHVEDIGGNWIVKVK